MNNKHGKNNFLVQGSILAIASIISRIIGLAYRVPLTRIIGQVGNNYYVTAYEVYNILLIISSYSLPLAVSKLVADRMAVGEAKNAKRVLNGALLFAAISGGIATLIVYFGGEYFTSKLLRTPLAIIPLKVLMPTLLCVALLGVLRGYFQGLGTMIPSAVSQIIEQIINAIVSVVAAYFLFSYGARIGRDLGNVGNYAAAYGAAGGTMGTAAGAFAALIFVLFLFLAYRKTFIKKVKRDHTGKDESYGNILVTLIMTIIPVLLSTTIYNVSSIVDQAVYKNIALNAGALANDINVFWGIYGGEYIVLVNVPIAIASAMAASCVPSITDAYKNRDMHETRRQISTSGRFVMIIAFPCSVGLFALGSPILQLLFKDGSDAGKNMMMLGAVAVVFFSLSTLMNGLLQGIDKLRIPVINALIALVVHVLLLMLLLKVTDLGIYAVVICNAVYGLVMCIMNFIALRHFSGVSIDYIKTLVIPLGASLVMGLIVFGVYKLLMLLIGSVTLGVLVSIIIGMVVYFAMLLLLKGITEEELYSVPMGRYLVSLGTKMHLI